MFPACQRTDIGNSDRLRIDLAHSLGFNYYPENCSAEPYLTYIENHRFSRVQPEEYIRLFIHVIEHFKPVHSSDDNRTTDSIATLLDSLSESSGPYFSESKAGSQERYEDVEDTVLYIIGAWTMMLSSFVIVPVAGGIRKITTAYNLRMQDGSSARHPYEQNISDLVAGSGLLPKPSQGHLPGNGRYDDMAQAALKLIRLLSNNGESSTSPTSTVDNLMLSSSITFNSAQNSVDRIPPGFLDDIESLESLSISATRLNALTLKVFGTVDIEWTNNLSRHMILSKRGSQHFLQIFALPCAFEATSIAQKATGIPSDLLQEIRESYSILFNAWPDKSFHVKFGLRFCCWCWPCSAYRYRKKAISDCNRACASKSRRSKNNGGSTQSTFDPLLLELMEYDASSDWTYDIFPHLWSRITSLELHLQTSRPWSIWVLFRDRRDTLQFWTFL
jgi:hypothetical protein